MPRCSARDTCCTGRHCPGSRAWRPRARRRGGCSAPCRGWGSSDAAREGAEGRVGLGVGTPLPRYRGMHSDEERLYLLLDRYLAGEASAGDAQAVRDWLAEHPDHPLFLDDLRLIRRVAAERTPESSVDAAWAKAQRPLEGPRPPRRSPRPLSLAPAAAAGRRPVVRGAPREGPAAPRA